METNLGDMSVGVVLSELTYISYASNRDRSPEVTPERWARIYPYADILEARYQADKAILNAMEAV